jgi:hypothetical protein
MRTLVRLIAGAVLIISGLGGLPATAASGHHGGSAERADHYRHYAACSVHVDAKPSHRCPKAGRKGAFFKSIDADVTYKVCVKFPSGRRLCAAHQEARRGEVRVNPITSHLVGAHVVTWFVAGARVGAFTFRIHA